MKKGYASLAILSLAIIGCESKQTTEGYHQWRQDRVSTRDEALARLPHRTDTRHTLGSDSSMYRNIRPVQPEAQPPQRHTARNSTPPTAAPEQTAAAEVSEAPRQSPPAEPVAVQPVERVTAQPVKPVAVQPARRPAQDATPAQPVTPAVAEEDASADAREIVTSDPVVGEAEQHPSVERIDQPAESTTTAVREVAVTPGRAPARSSRPANGVAPISSRAVAASSGAAWDDSSVAPAQASAEVSNDDVEDVTPVEVREIVTSDPVVAEADQQPSVEPSVDSSVAPAQASAEVGNDDVEDVTPVEVREIATSDPVEVETDQQPPVEPSVELINQPAESTSTSVRAVAVTPGRVPARSSRPADGVAPISGRTVATSSGAAWDDSSVAPAQASAEVSNDDVEDVTPVEVREIVTSDPLVAETDQQPSVEPINAGAGAGVEELNAGDATMRQDVVVIEGDQSAQAQAVQLHSEQNVAMVQDQAADWDKPSWISEAKLPADFPPPGPDDRIIVKQYPAHRVAEVSATEVEDASQNRMFKALYKHIKSRDIKMTSPVVIGYSEHIQGDPIAETLGFVYGDPQMGTVEEDGIVNVHDVQGQTVLSIGLRGSYKEEKFEDKLAQLHDYVDEHGSRYEVAGPPRFLRYNSPMMPWFMRYGEVQLPVNVRQ